MAVNRKFKLGEDVHFDVATHNVSGQVVAADQPPRFYIFHESNDIFIQSQVFQARAGFTVGYRSNFIVSGVLYDPGHFYSVYNSGEVNGITGFSIWGFSVTSGEVTPPTPAAIADAVWDEPLGGHVANDTFGSGVGAAILPIYYADIRYTYDKNATTDKDEYTVTWFKNAVQVESARYTGNVVIRGYDRVTGVAKFGPTGMTEDAASEGIWRHSESGIDDRILPGEAALVRISGIIDDENREWQKIVSRDSGVL